MERIASYFREEPARVVEAVRAVLFILPSLGIVLENTAVTAILTLVSLLASALLQERGVRARVSPLREIEEPPGFDVIVDEYSSDIEDHVEGDITQ